MVKVSQIKQLITNLDSEDIVKKRKPTKTNIQDHLLSVGVPHKYVFKLKQCPDTVDPLECVLHAQMRATILRFISNYLRFSDDAIKEAYTKEIRLAMSAEEKRVSKQQVKLVVEEISK